MDMRELAEMIAPATSAQVDKVAGRPTAAGMMGIPFALARDAAAPALSTVDAGIGALSSVGSDYPNVMNLANAALGGAHAAQGDPYFNERRNLFNAQAGGLRANTAMTNAETSMLNGFGGGPAGAGGMGTAGGGFEITDELLARMTAAGFQERANSLRQLRDDMRGENQSRAEREAYGRLWNPSQLDSRSKETKREWDQYRDIDLVRDKVESTPVSGLGVPVLVNILQQQIDPGAVVRGEDVRIITKGALSGADITVTELMQWLDANAGADIIVPKLKETVFRLLDSKEDDFAAKFDDAREAAGRLGMTEQGAKRAIPFWEQGMRAVKARDSRMTAATSHVDDGSGAAAAAAASASDGAASPSLTMPDADLNSLIGEVERDMPGLDDDAVFREVRRRMRAGGA